MNILAFDTSSAASSVALFCDGQCYAVHDITLIKQGTHLLPIIADLLKQADIMLSDLDVIALGIGPGSFTGLRIGCSAAQAIALAHQLPIIPISSLQLLAETAYRALGGEQFLVAVDARKDQCYWAHYIFQPVANCVQPVEKARLVNLADLPRLLNNQQSQDVLPGLQATLGVGNGWQVYRDHLYHLIGVADLMTCVPDLLPKADAMLPLVMFAYEKQDWVEAALLSPQYLNDMSFSITF